MIAKAARSRFITIGPSVKLSYSRPAHDDGRSWPPYAAVCHIPSDTGTHIHVSDSNPICVGGRIDLRTAGRLYQLRLGGARSSFNRCQTCPAGRFDVRGWREFFALWLCVSRWREVKDGVFFIAAERQSDWDGAAVCLWTLWMYLAVGIRVNRQKRIAVLGLS